MPPRRSSGCTARHLLPERYEQLFLLLRLGQDERPQAGVFGPVLQDRCGAAVAVLERTEDVCGNRLALADQAADLIDALLGLVE